jgi:predicted metal-binding protein
VLKEEAEAIENLSRTHGFGLFKWIDPREIVTGYWVRTKCIYGCPSYGKRACCPPENPSLGECQSLFAEYQRGLFFHLPIKAGDPQKRHAWARKINGSALALEREIFLKGFHKAFIFLPSPCNLCSDCKGRKNECANPSKARPTLESYCVDVFATARKFGYTINVLQDYEDEMNRYGAILIE